MIALIDSIPAWLTAITTLVAGATAFTALTPSNSDNAILDVILRLLNVLSGNVGKNVNKDAK